MIKVPALYRALVITTDGAAEAQSCSYISICGVEGLGFRDRRGHKNSQGDQHFRTYLGAEYPGPKKVNFQVW